MARVGYQLRQTGAEVQEAIDKIISLTLATSSIAGLMSPEDKTKLDSLGIHYNTTDYWDNARGYIPDAGEIIIYSDYKTVERNGIAVNVPGIKVGSGNGYVQDLAFVGEAEAESLLAHISDTAMHTTVFEKQFWNNKLNVDDAAEIIDDILILNRN